MTLNQYGMARKDRIVAIDPASFKIGYSISTLPGQSGSPVIAEGSIVAVHNGGGMGKDEFNIGRLFDAEMIVMLKIWAM
jgi:V8-like Glu-specific endopeptidase